MPPSSSEQKCNRLIIVSFALLKQIRGFGRVPQITTIGSNIPKHELSQLTTLESTKESGLWDGDKSIFIKFDFIYPVLPSLVLFYSRAKNQMTRTIMIWVSPGILVKAGHLQ